MNSKLRKNELCPIHKRYYCCGREAQYRSHTQRVVIGHDGKARQICSPAELRRRKNILIEAQQNRCANKACQKEFRHYYEAELDHIVARKMGGGFRDDSFNNLRVLCRDCHRARHEGKLQIA